MNHLYITTHKDPSLIKSGDVFFTSWSGREGASFFHLKVGILWYLTAPIQKKCTFSMLTFV